MNGSTETKPTWVVGLGGLLEPRGFLPWRKLRKSVRILVITVVESLSGVEGKVFLFFSVYFLKGDFNPLCVCGNKHHLISKCNIKHDFLN